MYTELPSLRKSPRRSGAIRLIATGGETGVPDRQTAHVARSEVTNSLFVIGYVVLEVLRTRRLLRFASFSCYGV